MASIQYFEAFNCSLQGTIPASWAEWGAPRPDRPDFKWAWISDNPRLTGCLPGSWSKAMQGGISESKVLPGTNITGFC